MTIAVLNKTYFKGKPQVKGKPQEVFYLIEPIILVFEFFGIITYGSSRDKLSPA